MLGELKHGAVNLKAKEDYRDSAKVGVQRKEKLLTQQVMSPTLATELKQNVAKDKKKTVAKTNIYARD